jgi:hypothetical protein
MARGRPRKNPADVLIKSAELIGWALGGIEQEIVETRNRLASLTAQANQLRARVGTKKDARGGARVRATAPDGGRNHWDPGTQAPQAQDVARGAQAYLREDEEDLGGAPQELVGRVFRPAISGL